MKNVLLFLLWLPLSLIGQSDPLIGMFYQGTGDESGLVYFQLKLNGEYAFSTIRVSFARLLKGCIVREVG